MDVMCWKCGKAILAENPVGRTLVCESCGSDVRSCRNCLFWSPGSYHDCAERVEDAVRDKERANFCDSFRLNPAFKIDHAPAPGAGGKPGTGSSAAKAAFDGLFGE